MAEISIELKQHLINDAHLRVARSVLEETRNDLQTRIEALEKTQSSVDRLMAVAGRPREISATIKATRDELTKVHASLETLEKVGSHLLPKLVDLTESHVRVQCPEYLKGLAAVNDFSDWALSIERFQRKIDAYLQAMGTARNMMTSGYDQREKRISAGAEEALERAIHAAAELEEETTFINKVSDAHQSAVADTPHANAVLPRIPVAMFQEWTQRLRQISSIPAAQEEFSRILAMCEMLRSTGVLALEDAVKRAAQEHSDLSRSFVMEYLGQLRAYTDEHWLNLEETPTRVQTLERDQLGFSNFPWVFEA
jgi:seryl-tRNA synthetase